MTYIVAPSTQGANSARAEVEAVRSWSARPEAILQHQVENPLAALLHGLLAVEDGAAIDVHVVFHALDTSACWSQA